MASSNLPDRVTDFIDGLGSLSAAEWATVLATRKQLIRDGAYLPAGKAAKTSAAQHSAIQKRILDVLRTQAESVYGASTTGMLDASTAAERAAIALLLGDRMAPEHAATLVEPFIAAGMPRTQFFGEQE